MLAKHTVGVLACCLVLGHSAAVVAGMPAPLPTDLPKTLRLNESAIDRLQAISFFLIGFLFCAGIVQLAWNYLRRDFPFIPRLTYAKALAVVFLWGLLFVIVLTMISGARELMTPGAWTKQGFTYKLTEEAKKQSEANRRQHLERLRTCLLQFAATHQGRFPTRNEIAAIPADLWEVPGSGGMRYFYVPGKMATNLPEILVYEPETEPNQRLVLKTNGDIVTVPTAEIQAAAPGGATP
jgi:hypothetical protein